LKAAFKVATLVTQKLIKKKDVRPINSQPKNNITKLPDVTKKTMLKTNKHKNNKSLSTRGSYLKYEKVKA
jgi:hypothetical protein